MISLIIPAYNEQETIASSIDKLSQYLKPRNLEYELIIAANGCTDGTVKIVSELMRANANLKLIEIGQRSVGQAFAQAVQQARGELIISLDADLSSDLVFIEYAVNLFPFFDMLVGSKTMGTQRRTLLRMLGSQCYILFAQWLFDLSISDYSLGSKAYRRSTILPALKYIDAWTGYVFELCLYLKLRTRRLLQVGIDCEDNRKSRFSLLHEGYYRYLHLFKQHQRLKDPTCWLNPRSMA